jgi:hypothetical protein
MIRLKIRRNMEQQLMEFFFRYLENTFHSKILISYFSYHKPIVPFLEYDDTDEGHLEQNSLE